MLAQILPGPDVLLRDELRIMWMSLPADEVQYWSKLPPGNEVLRGGGATPLTAGSGDNYYRQSWYDASVDVNGIAGGDAFQRRTITPGFAQAKVSMRLAPGQRSA